MVMLRSGPGGVVHRRLAGHGGQADDVAPEEAVESPPAFVGIVAPDTVAEVFEDEVARIPHGRQGRSRGADFSPFGTRC